MRRGGLGSKLLNIALLVIVTLAMGVAEAAGTGSNVLVGFANSSLAAGPGDIITVSIVVDPDGYGVQSGELVLYYDREGLEVVSVAPGGIWGDSPLVVRKEYNDTAIVLVVARPGSPATEPGSAVEVVFRVVGSDGIYTVRIARAVFADSDGNDLPVYVEANECLVKVGTSTTKTTEETTATSTSASTVGAETTTVTETVTVTKTVTATATVTTTATVTVTEAVGKTITTTLWREKTTTVTETTTRTMVQTPGWAYAAPAVTVIVIVLALLSITRSRK